MKKLTIKQLTEKALKDEFYGKTIYIINDILSDANDFLVDKSTFIGHPCDYGKVIKHYSYGQINFIIVSNPAMGQKYIGEQLERKEFIL